MSVDKITVEYEAAIQQFQGQLKNLEAQMAAVETRAKSSSKKAGDAFEKQSGIVNILRGNIQKLTEARDKSNNPKLLDLYNQKIDAANIKLKALTSTTQKLGEETQKTVKTTSGLLDNLGSKLVAAFAVERVIAFAGNVIKVTGEFQKLEAVLTNTLGSNAAAKQALTLISDFAATTNFSVKELTEGFVKLANQGFIPTKDQLRQLGDVANSTGKTFDQLAEAIIDAQTGEFERLKEFGIRAQKEGDKVSFTFKGVKTQTDFTNESIREYILSLGELEGVSGSTAAISQTLEGKISNLGDAFDKMFLSIGKSGNGAIGFVIDLTQKLVNSLGESIAFLNNPLQYAREAAKEEHRKAVDDLKEYYKTLDEFDQQVELLRLQNIVDSGKKLSEAELDSLRNRAEAIAELLKERTEAAEKELTKIQKGLIQELEEKIDALTKNKKTIIIEADITKANIELKKLKDELDRLNNLGTESKEAKELREKQKKDQLEVDTILELIDQQKNKRRIEREKELQEGLTKEDRDGLDKRVAYANKKLKEQKDEEKRLAKEAEDYKKKIKEASVNFAHSTINDIIAFERDSLNIRTENEINAIQQQEDEALDSLDKRKDAGLISERQYNAEKDRIQKEAANKEKQLKLKAAEQEKELQIFSIFINTLAAVTKASPLVPLMAFAAAQGALAMGLVAARPLPKFAKGGEIDGKLHSEGGTVIEAERGEYMINRKDYSKNKEVVKAINLGYGEKWIEEKRVLPALKAQKKKNEQAEQSMAHNIYNAMKLMGFDDSNLTRAIKKNNSVDIKNADAIGKAIAKHTDNSIHSQYK